MADRNERMALVAEEITNLVHSPLYEFRQQRHYHPVIGEGNLDAPIMVVGEAPGEAGRGARRHRQRSAPFLLAAE